MWEWIKQELTSVRVQTTITGIVFAIAGPKLGLSQTTVAEIVLLACTLIAGRSIRPAAHKAV
jgi:hypothetical protein